MINTSKGIVFFDTETTGILKDGTGNISSNGDLIQLAYRVLLNGDKKDENIFVNTDTNIEIGSMAVHGLYKDLLVEKSGGNYLNDEIVSKVVYDFTGNVLVAHNLDFDRDVLLRSGIDIGDNLIDTLKISKILLSEGFLINEDGFVAEYVNLQYLRYFFKLYTIVDSKGNEENTTAHDALGDVIVLENVFYSLFNIIKVNTQLDDNGIIDLMIKMSKKKYILVDIMKIGKYRGKSFEEVSSLDPGYLEWMIGADFSDDIKYTCRVYLGHISDDKFLS